MINKYFVVVLFCLVKLNLLGQEMSDLIVTNKQDSIKCEITLINGQNIFFNYKPKRNVKSSYLSRDSVLIIYSKDFQIVKFEDDKDDCNPEKNITSLSHDSVKAIITRFDGNYILIGVGIGYSYGALGVRTQIRRGGKFGYGFHAGLGVIPDEGYIVGSLGTKLFIYKGFYLNGQFGSIGFSYIKENGITTVTRDYGVSFLVGTDWCWATTRDIGFGMNIAGGLTRILNASDVKVIPCIDFGFFVKF